MRRFVEEIEQKGIVTLGFEVIREDPVEAGLEHDVVVARDHPDLGDLVPEERILVFFFNWEKMEREKKRESVCKKERESETKR